MTSVPKTRVEKKKIRSKKAAVRNKRLTAGVGLLLILCVAYFVMKDFHQQAPKTDVAASKPITKTSHPANNSKSNTSTSSTEKKSKSNTSTAKSEENSKPAPPDYLLPASDKRVLSEGDIATLTKGQLRIARNEIYARHGYVFKSPDLQNYFSSKSWYHTDPSYNGALNQIEKENVTLLKTREDRL